ncbi:MAG: ATP-binding protein [Candidatus Geothermincolia bacterium]
MDRKYWPLFHVITAFLVLAIFTFAFMPGGERAFRAQTALLTVGSALLALIFLTGAAISFDTSEPARRIWGYLALAELFNCLAESVSSYYVIYRDMQPPAASMVDILAFLSYFPLALGIFAFMKGFHSLGMRLERRSLVIGGGVIVVMSALASRSVYLPILQANANGLTKVYQFGYAAVDIIILGAAVSIALTLRGSSGTPFRILAAGFFLLTLADLGYSWVTLQGADISNSGAGLFRIGGNLVIAAGALYLLRPAERAKKQRRAEVSRLRSLNKLSRTISGLLGPDMIAASVLPEIEGVLEPDLLRLMVCDQEQATIYRDSNVEQRECISLGDSGKRLLAAAYHYRIDGYQGNGSLPHLIHGDVAAHGDFMKYQLPALLGPDLPASLEEKGIRSFLFCNFHGRGGANGCLFAGWHAHHALDELALESISSICELAGLCMQNALDYESLLSAKHDSESANGLMSDMVNLISHEIRHPLTIIGGYASTLMSYDIELSDEKKMQILGTMLKSVERLTALSDELVWASRIQGDNLPLQLEEVDLRHMALEQAMEVANNEMPRFVFKLDDDVPLVESDVNKLRVILKNLYANALNYSEPESQIEVGMSRNGADIRFWVRDYGAGIPTESLDRIFDRFYQVRDARHHHTGGLGLGLYITRNLVRCLGGEIWAESDPGYSATFIFTLPVKVQGKGRLERSDTRT